MRLVTTIISRRLDDWTKETVKLASESDKIIVVPGGYYKEPDAEISGPLVDDFLEELNMGDKLKVIKQYAYWRHPGEKFNKALHEGSTMRDDWFLFLHEGDRLEITKEFKEKISDLAGRFPAAHEIMIPTAAYMNNTIKAPGEYWPAFRQNLIKLQEGVYTSTHHAFLNNQNVDLKNDPAIQKYRILDTKLETTIKNYRMQDLLDEEYEKFFAREFRIPDWDIKNNESLDTGNKTLFEKLIEYAPEEVRKIK
jgi:hypothetical protein